MADQNIQQQAAPPTEPGLTPDYWHGQWYEDIKSFVLMVGTEMHNVGVDPGHIAADDAWRVYAERARRGHMELAARGIEVPQVYRDFVQEQSPGSRVFIAMWTFQDWPRVFRQMGA